MERSIGALRVGRGKGRWRGLGERPTCRAVQAAPGSLLSCLSKRMLPTFLLANLATGLCNMTWPLYTIASSWVASGLIVVYATLVMAAAPHL